MSHLIKNCDAPSVEYAFILKIYSLTQRPKHEKTTTTIKEHSKIKMNKKVKSEERQIWRFWLCEKCCHHFEHSKYSKNKKIKTTNIFS